MQVSADGFVAGPNGELDWMEWDWDDKIKKYVSELTASIDTILMGRKMAGGFVEHWTKVLDNPADPDYDFARIMVDTPKVVFSKTLDKSEWANTVIAKGDLTEEVNKLKNQPGKDIIVYGGASFVTSLINAGLIDEYHLFVNPTAIGNGMRIFTGRTNLRLINAQTFGSGEVELVYVPKK